jgi:hypothetical protein
MATYSGVAAPGLAGEHVDDVPRGELEDQKLTTMMTRIVGTGLDEASPHEARDARSGQHHPNTRGAALLRLAGTVSRKLP